MGQSGSFSVLVHHSGGHYDQPGQLDEIVGSHLSVNLKSSFFTPDSMGPTNPPMIFPPNGPSTRKHFLLADLVPAMAVGARCN
jgi:hypothetical protein